MEHISNHKPDDNKFAKLFRRNKEQSAKVKGKNIKCVNFYIAFHWGRLKSFTDKSQKENFQPFTQKLFFSSKNFPWEFYLDQCQSLTSQQPTATD